MLILQLGSFRWSHLLLVLQAAAVVEVAAVGQQARLVQPAVAPWAWAQTRPLA